MSVPKQHLFLLAILLLLLPSCGRVQNPRFAGLRQGTSNDIVITVDRPPDLKVGVPARVTVHVREDEVPLRGAVVALEGNMTHAGMEPLFVEAQAVAPGEYQAEMEWTMGGEWFLHVRVTLPDGESIEYNVPSLEVETP